MVELIKEAAQTSSEIHACDRGDPDHDDRAHDRDAARAFQRSTDLAQSLEPGLKTRTEIDHGRDRLPVREQRRLPKLQERLVGGEEAICPYQTAVDPDAPTVQDVSGKNLLAAFDAAKNQPLEGNQFGAGAHIDLGLSRDARLVEDDRLLWKPRKLGISLSR
ncbi:hypothetical protein AB7M69_002478 [Bradyrhizobium japonicum]